MKKYLHKSLLIFLLFYIYIQTNAKELHVLFLGNSYTYVNNLPQVIHDIAITTGDTLIFDSNTPGGYTLQQHLTDSISLNKIMLGNWDYVIMQEQSQLPSFEDYDDYYAYRLCSIIQQYSPCARSMFYMTWGRKNGDALNCPVWPPVCTYEGMDSLLRISYLEMAGNTKSEVSPVGEVWNYIRHNYSLIELYQADESHPSLAGTYAAACSFYSSLFRKDPSLTTYDYSLSASDAAQIRLAAKSIVYDSLANFDFGDYLPHADFLHFTGTGINEIEFRNTSLNADYYLWEFGDGSTSDSLNINHSYTTNGIYTARLTAYNCDLSVLNQSSREVTISICAHDPRIYPDSLRLCPNVSDTLWTQSSDAYQWADDEGNFLINDTNRFLITSTPGFYSVYSTLNGCTELSPSVYVGSYSSGLIFYWVDTMIYSTHADTLCNGDSVMIMLRTNKPDRGDGIRQWSKNNIDLPAANSDTLIVTTSGDYRIRIINPNCQDANYYEGDLFPINFIACNIGLEELEEMQEIMVLPNPFSTHLIIKSSERSVGKNYTIINSIGEIILQGRLTGVVTFLETENFTSGVYFLKTDYKNFLLVKQIE
jgi:hypothetical protein